MSLITVGTAYNIVAAVLVVLSFTLLVISLVAWRKSGNRRIAIVSISFLFFFLEGVLFTYQLFYSTFSSEMFATVIGILNVVILLFIFAATFKR